MLQSKGSLKVRHDWTTSLSLFTFMEKEMATHSSVLAWKIPGTGEPHGPPSMGSHRVRHDWSNLAAAAVAIHERCIMCNFTYMVQFSSATQLRPTLWPHGLQHLRLPCPSPTPRAWSKSCSSSWWCHPIISSSVYNFSQHQGLFKWVSSSHQLAKVLEFQHQHRSFQWIFSTDFL